MSYYIVAIHIVELIAALSGTYYYLKTKDDQMKIFIWYLWFVVFIETVGMYGYLLLNNYDYDWFIWLKNSVFCSNTWLYNIYSFVTIFIFGKFFLKIIHRKSSKIIIVAAVVFYTIFTVLYFLISGTFFQKSLPYDLFVETFIVFVFVMLYYKQLLGGDEILFFRKLPVFYISSGLLLFYLCAAPLFTFDGYFYEVNKGFIQFRHIYMFIINIFLYSCFIFAFLYTIQFKKELAKRR
ncbi:hypothetical protein BWZ20_03185 [Winogradskyella sp. J14-2]|uniref:hypothetical protein n=1 Tax=Winogradskyella sp. J14-2 TaxID=1936080 RepID=UPI000972E91A|nr:hypothetical protein [Winogradskyella sp. J14-2]APY07363.1 hypothetical protein BWZ20_03185 [Winogradskyella sp. J14-2]